MAFTFNRRCLEIKKKWGLGLGGGRKIKLITRNLNKREVNISYKLWNQIIRIRFNLLNLEMYIYNLERSGRLNHGGKIGTNYEIQHMNEL